MEIILKKYALERFKGEYFFNNFTFKISLENDKCFLFLSKNLNEQIDYFENKENLELFFKSLK